MKSNTKFVVTALLLSCLAACEQPTNISAGVSQTPTVTADINHGFESNPQVIRWNGFGPASFGDSEESVRMAWGGPLIASEAAFGATCYQLFSRSEPPHGMTFMMEDGGFRRYGVDMPPTIPAHVGPGGIHVGGPVNILTSQFGSVSVASHKYDKDRLVYSVIAPESEVPSQLIVETEQNGTVTSWRIGQLPQVLYSEGCN